MILPENIYYYNLIIGSTNIFNYFTKLSLLTEIMGLLSGFSISTSTTSFSFLLEKFLLKCSLIKYLHLITIATNLIFQFKSLPHFVQKAIRPPKQVPNYGKNVNWMHNKLKLIVNLPGGEEG